MPRCDVEQAFGDGPSVSVEGILTHSSGLPRESAHPYCTGPEFPFPSRDEIIEGLAGQETLYPADRYFQYSNLGMALAGQLVEQASGMDFDAYVRGRILDPLGMSDTYTDIPEEHRGDRFATGYTRLGRDGRRDEATSFQARGIAPAAGFSSTVEDLETVGAALESVRSDPDGGTPRPAALAEYEGLYESSWGETVILRWDDGLVALRVPTRDPVESMTKLRRDGRTPFAGSVTTASRARRTSSIVRMARSLGSACTGTTRGRCGRRGGPARRSGAPARDAATFCPRTVRRPRPPGQWAPAS